MFYSEITGIFQYFTNFKHSLSKPHFGFIASPLIITSFIDIITVTTTTTTTTN